MKRVFSILIIGVTLVGCSSFPRQKHSIIIEKNLNNVAPKFQPRSTKYISCIRNLNHDGIKQALIKELCNEVLGSIE